MRYDGYLNGNDGWTFFGWAIDHSQPEVPVQVEYELSTGVSGTVTADDFREDLLRNGIGDGRHAFTVLLPQPPAGHGAVTISARIKGTSFTLKDSPMLQATRRPVSLVAADIVNNCNLRCPFCVVDYTNIRGLKLMSETTFRAAMDLMPALPPGGFWMSCLHEPTLHPKFVDYIEMVPLELRDRISFTTNLSKRLPDDWLPRLANSGVHSVRVSFDSRNPDLFGQLRKGAKYETFIQNLEQFTSLLKGSKRRPRLHFITMAFRENLGEIADMIRYGRQVLGAAAHEVRFMFYLPHLAHWGREHLVSPQQWSELEATLQPLKSDTELTICGPMPGAREQFEHEQGLTEYVARENAFGGADNARRAPPPTAQQLYGKIAVEPLRLRLRWDGLLALDSYAESTFAANIEHLAPAASYFDQLYAELRLIDARMHAVQLTSRAT